MRDIFTDSGVSVKELLKRWPHNEYPLSRATLFNWKKNFLELEGGLNKFAILCKLLRYDPVSELFDWEKDEPRTEILFVRDPRVAILDGMRPSKRTRIQIGSLYALNKALQDRPQGILKKLQRVKDLESK